MPNNVCQQVYTSTENTYTCKHFAFMETTFLLMRQTTNKQNIKCIRMSHGLWSGEVGKEDKCWGRGVCLGSLRIILFRMINLQEMGIDVLFTLYFSELFL